jgi:hypothetical protein
VLCGSTVPALKGTRNSEASGLNFASTYVFNQAMQYGGGLVSSAMAAGSTSYPLRSGIYRGLLNASENLADLSESITSEAIVGDAGIVAVDVLLLNALGSEYQSVRNGTCIPEGVALRVIAFGQ